MAKHYTYTFSSAGSMTGRVTGTLHKWAVGESIDAPAGEFGALPCVYATLAKPKAKPKAKRKKKPTP